MEERGEENEEDNRRGRREVGENKESVKGKYLFTIVTSSSMMLLSPITIGPPFNMNNN